MQNVQSGGAFLTLLDQPDGEASVSGFLGVEISLLRTLLVIFKRLDLSKDEDFQGMIRAIVKFFPIKMSQKQLASRLSVSPMTLQRWGHGKSLPYLIPRTAYRSILIEIVEDHISEALGSKIKSEEYDGHLVLDDLLNGARVCEM